MHFFTDDDVRRLITLRDAIEHLRFALEEHGRGDARIQPRVGTRGDDIMLSTMGAIQPNAGVCGVKVCSTHRGKFARTSSAALRPAPFPALPTSPAGRCTAEGLPVPRIISQDGGFFSMTFRPAHPPTCCRRDFRNLPVMPAGSCLDGSSSVSVHRPAY